MLLPCFLFAHGARSLNVRLVRVAAVIGVLGVVLNRLNLSVITFNWHMHNRYVPHWMELVMTVSIVLMGILCFRWLVNRVPVLAEHPDYKGTH